MNTAILDSSGNRPTLRRTLVKIINAKIQYADYKLKKFMSDIMKSNQTPGRPIENNTFAADAQNRVFDIIENSSLHTTKLLYLRANITEHNSDLILQIISNDELQSITLDQVKEKIKA